MQLHQERNYLNTYLFYILYLENQLTKKICGSEIVSLLCKQERGEGRGGGNSLKKWSPWSARIFKPDPKIQAKTEFPGKRKIVEKPNIRAKIKQKN